VYITPPDTTGVAAYTPAPPLGVIGTVHATPSWLTVELLIGPLTSRVFARSAPGRLQVLETAAAPACRAVEALDVLLE